MSLKARLLFLGMTLFLSGCGDTAYYINSGFWKMKRDLPSEAKVDFIKALLREPGSMSARYNLAMSNLKLEQIKDSLTELDLLENLYTSKYDHFDEAVANHSEELYRIYFAKGFVYGLIQDVPSALEAYQKALFIKPESIEVKHNIELLTMQSQQGSKGKSGQKKKGQKGDGKNSDSDGESKDEKDSGKDENKSDEIKGRDDESLKKRKLSKEEIEQILKEIKEQESKVRSKENRGKAKKGAPNDKTW
jgi:tetratricopeptide (TPR) repeat protein